VNINISDTMLSECHVGVPVLFFYHLAIGKSRDE